MNKKIDFEHCGEEMHQLVSRLFPICRSITGDGVRETLKIIQEYIPLEVFEVPSGTKVFYWTIPREWNIRDAYILNENGEKIVDFQKNNLHVVGYSVPVNKKLTLSELQEHLYSLEDQPDAIPYITSYYKERWGFCLAHNQRMALQEGTYQVVIDSELKDGHLTYGELIIPGEREEEIFLSTYICHPSMANNELSGPVVTTFLAKWISEMPRRYTYRIIFIPETIGSITYLSRHLDYLKKHVIAGFNITCVGDERAYSFLPSRNGGTLADRVALTILKFKHPDFRHYSFLDRGSDERQYCSPGVDLPVVSLMRSKYGTYPEYHTSLDNLELVTAEALMGSLSIHKFCIELIENNITFKSNTLGEPQLGKRGLYPELGTKNLNTSVKEMMDVLTYCDGTNDIIDLSDKTRIPTGKIISIIKKFEKENLIRS